VAAQMAVGRSSGPEGSSSFPPGDELAQLRSADPRYCRCRNKSSSSYGRYARDVGSGSSAAFPRGFDRPTMAVVPATGTLGQAMPMAVEAPDVDSWCTASVPAGRDWVPACPLSFRLG
jgi:hypothetical protein